MMRVTLGPGDWQEDQAHENGNYNCRCVRCGGLFVGHKRRVVCKVCHNEEELK